ncbi:MAG: hypothetical protein KBF80_07660 [Flavobacteriales bacterium]|nr:hypothetical protein [Flavobacteriales bacterium]
MHILLACYTFPPALGIGGRRWAKYAKGLAQAGHHVHVLCAEAVPGRAGSSWTEDVKHDRIHLYPLPRRYPKVATLWDRTHVWNDLRYRAWMKVLPHLTQGNHIDLAIFWRAVFMRKAEELIARHPIRHIIASGAPFRLLVHAAELKKRHPELHLTADLRDPWTWGRQYDIQRLSPRRMAQEKTMEALVMEMANIVTAPSPDMVAHLRSAYPQHAHKYHELPHAVDPDDIPANPFERHSPPRRLIYAGSWRGKEDGHAYMDAVINTFRRILSNMQPGGLPPVFDIYARPNEVLDARQQVEQVGLEGSIRFHGVVNGREAGRHIADADAALVFIPDENRNYLGTKFNELFHQRIPVVHVGAPGRISRFIESNRLGVSITVQEVEKELPKLISGERPILVDTNFDTGPVILDHLSKHLVALMEA